MDLRPLGPKVLVLSQGLNMAFSAESICGVNNDGAIGSPRLFLTNGESPRCCRHCAGCKSASPGFSVGKR